jgi:acetyltransferase-like isoleucine patch superfamily enzyme
VSRVRKLAHDWYDGTVPDNVVYDDTNYIDTSYYFRRFRSRAEDALKLGRGASVYNNTVFDLGRNARVEIGAFTMVNGANMVCDDAIRIGDHTLISWNVVLMDTYRTPRTLIERRAYLEGILRGDAGAIKTRAWPVVIGSNVWIGHDCVILPGVSIGNGSVIGARSVIVESIPDFAVAAGNPARVIRRL